MIPPPGNPKNQLDAGRMVHMRTALLSLFAAIGLGFFSGPALAQEKGGDDRTGPYDVAQGWPQPLALAKPGYIWGSTGGIFAETPNKIFIANRGELKLPATLPPNFTGFWGAFGEQATTPTPDFRDCIVAVDRAGDTIESTAKSDYAFEAELGPQSEPMSPDDE